MTRTSQNSILIGPAGRMTRLELSRAFRGRQMARAVHHGLPGRARDMPDSTDLLMDSFEGVVDRLVGASSRTSPTGRSVQLPSGQQVAIVVDGPVYDGFARDRFDQICRGAREIAQRERIGWPELAVQLFEADGWPMLPSVRSPCWLPDSFEVEHAEADKIAGEPLPWR